MLIRVVRTCKTFGPPNMLPKADDTAAARIPDAILGMIQSIKIFNNRILNLDSY